MMVKQDRIAQNLGNSSESKEPLEEVRGANWSGGINVTEETNKKVGFRQEGTEPSLPASGSGSEPAGSEPAGAPTRGKVENLTAMGQGRPKGVPNKLTRNFKAAAEEAFAKGGGVDWLVRMMNGTASDRAAVLGLYGRLIPAQLQAQVDTTVRVELGWLGQRGIGRVTEDDVRSLDAPQAASLGVQQAVGDVVEGVIVDAAGQQGGAGGSDA